MSGVWIKLRYPDKDTLMLAFRMDLKRVAKLKGLPDGHAPTWLSYKKHGRFAVGALKARVLNVRNGYGSWLEAMKKLGLVPQEKHVEKELDFLDVVAELDKVRSSLGLEFGIAPPVTQYIKARRRGEADIDVKTIYKMAKTRSWVEAMQFFNHKPYCLALGNSHQFQDQYPREFKLRIVKEVDEAPHGQKSKVIEREGISWSTVWLWRTARKNGKLQAA